MWRCNLMECNPSSIIMDPTSAYTDCKFISTLLKSKSSVITQFSKSRSEHRVGCPNIGRWQLRKYNCNWKQDKLYNNLISLHSKQVLLQQYTPPNELKRIATICLFDRSQLENKSNIWNIEQTRDRSWYTKYPVHRK